MLERLPIYWRLTRMDRPIGWLLLLWPTLWALWIASDGSPQPRILVVFVVGTVVMRAAGCIVNDYLDRDLDRHVARTQDRPLTTGEVSVSESAWLFLTLMLVALALVLTLNRLTLLLAIVGSLLMVFYPLLKRFTHLPQLYLGIVFSWGILMAFAAETGSLPTLVWWLFLANLLWTVAYDTMYAMADRPDDEKAGIKSIAILVGHYDLVFNACLQGVAIFILIYVGQILHLGSWFYAGLLSATVLVIYQIRLCKDRDRDLCLKAFLNNSWFGASIFVGIVLSYITTA